MNLERKGKKIVCGAKMDWNCSGDTDVIIPVTTTRYSMAKLRAPVKTPWYPWDFQGEVRERMNLRLVLVSP